MIPIQEFGLQRQQQIESRRPPFEHETIASFNCALERKARNEPDNLYPRDGSFELTNIENISAEYICMPRGKVVWFNSGMATVVACIETVSPTLGDVIIHGNQSYSRTTEYIKDDLKDRGVKNFVVDPGSIYDIQKAVERYQPKIISLETVVNGTEMAVLDLNKFLELPILREVDPLIILDNTLPTSSNLHLASFMEKHRDLKIIGVESATKFYALNHELGGFAFSYNDQLLERLFKKRVTRGVTPGPSAVETITKVIPPTKEEFDKANKLITSNTHRLAEAFEKASETSGSFLASYPNLPDHPNYQLANAICPNGISPVLFLIPTNPDQLSHIEIAKVIWEKILKGRGHLAPSFGFGRTGISYDPKASYVRIAGGMESPEEIAELSKDIKDILSAI